MAVTVMVGSARIDENGHARGGRAGDQTGKEVSTQSWYKHSKGWRVLRCIDPDKAKKIAIAMKAACANSHIGYDQNQRDTLYTTAKPYGFDPAKVKTDCETDCSALVRVCMAYAGIPCGSFNTTVQASAMINTGMFTELTGSKYTDQSVYLKAGDVLVTRTQGHTVVVLNDGSKAEDTIINKATTNMTLGDRTLWNGDTGNDVKELQTKLIALGYTCGSWGVDGDFGDATEIAVRKFQKDHGLEEDGVVGSKTVEALNGAFSGNTTVVEDSKKVQIMYGDCYVRDQASKSEGRILGVAKNGKKFTYFGETSKDGWNKIDFNGTIGWVSGKYSKIVA